MTHEMARRGDSVPVLDGCNVLPAMDPPPTERGAATAEHGRNKPSKPKGMHGDRFAVLNAFVDFTAGTLPRSELLVWLTLYRDCRDGLARTSQATVARRCRLGRRTVVRAVAALERRGLLKAVYRGGLNRGPTSYRVRALVRDA